MEKENWKCLQPLRIPAGWTVMFHKLEVIEPEEIPNEDIFRKNHLK